MEHSNEINYFAMKLKKCRQDSGLTAAEAGEAVGKSNKTILAWENGTNQPSAKVLIDLCKLYKVSISAFFPEEVTYGAVDLDDLDELEIIETYRSLDDDKKKMMIAFARTLKNVKSEG